jgi:predicted regulator of Ras-like GTPase activity (Roadblock/LC7/MglB family)
VSESAQKIQKILEQIASSVPGIQRCVLMDRTGMLVSSFQRFSKNGVDLDAASAIMGAVFQAAEEEGSTLTFGSLEIQINEFKNGFRFGVACEDVGVLSVITEKDVQIGMVRASMKKNAPTLAKLMKKLLGGTPTGLAMEDLRDLFSSEKSGFM